MSAKKRTEQGEETNTNIDPLEPNIDAINPDFDLDALISACREKLASESKLKVPIQERIQKNREALERIKRTIAQLEIKAAQSGTLTWCEGVITKIVEQLQAVFPNASVDYMTLVHSGAITVTVSKKTSSMDKKGLTNSKAITFVPINGELFVKDFSHNLQTYAPGSWGDICLQNFENLKVPNEKSIAFILEYLR